MKKINLIIGLLLIISSIIIPVSLTYKLLLVFIASIYLWITSPIEIGSIICLCGLALLPQVKINDLFVASFGNSTIMFLIFSMLLTYGLSECGILKKIAIWFIDNQIARVNIFSFLACYFLSILILGSFIAPTTIFVLFFGIAKEIYECMGLKKGDPYAKAIMIGTGFFASISCAWTPIAHTFPIMALGYYETLTGNTISYLSYMKRSIPIGFLISVFAYLILAIKLQKYNNSIKVHFEHEKLNKNQIINTIIFILVILCWLITGIWPQVFSKLNSLTTAFPAMVGCILMATFGTLDIKKGLKDGVSWSAILLCAATLALGKVINMEEFGVVSTITNLIGNKISLLFIIIFTIVLTNCISNIVTTTLAFNIFIPTAVATGIINPVIGTIAIGMGASLAFALPSSIAHIALAGSSGYATAKDMFKYGIVMVIISIIVMGVFING